MKRIPFLCVSILIAACSAKEQKESSLTIQPIIVPTSGSSAEPFLYTDDSVTYLTWVEKGDSGASLKLSRLGNSGWTAPITVATGSTWFVNWADYPMVAAKGNKMMAHFLDRNGESKYAYDVKLTMSGDGGVSWSHPIVLHDDKKQAEHGFVTLLPYGENFFVTWLDGRNTVMEGMEGMEDMDHGHPGAMSLLAAILDPSGNKISEWELDNKTCDCCQTTAAISDNGPVVIYRDRTDDEIRDMSIVRLVDGAWTKPVPVHMDNWKIAGCPVNGPRAAYKGNTMAVAWFSLAADTAAVNVKFSDDGGNSFGPLIRMDEGNAIGRVDIELLDTNSAVVTWMEGGEIKLAKVNVNGEKTDTVTVAKSTEARSSGFPQLAIAKDRVVVAWTDDNEKTVKTAIILL